MADQAVGKITTSDCAGWVPPPELAAELRYLEPLAELPEQRSLLKSVIENDVIPRLLLTNDEQRQTDIGVADDIVSALSARVGEFSEIVINQDDTMSMAYVERLLDQGIPIETLFEDLLAPTARRLGELWTEDINDFFDVTTGIGRLQHIVRTFGRDYCDYDYSLPLSTRCALLMPVPGEQHTFGISLLRENLLREGWRVWCGQCREIDEIIQLVKIQSFDMVGLSASALADPEALARDIKRIRAASANKTLRILVGGFAFDSQPDLVAAVGADATATDSRHAVLVVLQSILP